MIDTAPLLDKYRKDTEKYPDACKQNMDKQLAWLDSVLTTAKEDWVLVIGHHPIYADTDKSESERTDLQNVWIQFCANIKCRHVFMWTHS